MYDAVTLDQLRAFLSVVEEGSFSAAARRLRRVQSAISTAMANLESRLGVVLWDRSTKVPTLTAEGEVVVVSARRVLAEVDQLHQLTRGMAGGLEASVALCLDAFFPLNVLVDLCRGFAREFPSVHLRVDTQVMSAVAARVLRGDATLGVVSPLGLSPSLESLPLAAIRMVPVVGVRHPLAEAKGPISQTRLAAAVQIVLSEDLQGPRSGVADQGVLSPQTWRVSDLQTKAALIAAGLGWGNLPEHLARDAVRARRLKVIRPAAWRPDEHVLRLSVIHRAEQPLGPAHRWIMAQMSSLCDRELGRDASHAKRARTPINQRKR
jgi:DNA-binding transcriptional LysR family regulator